MSRHGHGDALDFVDFCDWLHQCGDDRAAHDLLCVLLGEPHDADLLLALRRARRVVAVMSVAERLDPSHIDAVRRSEIATEANVDLADVSELILRFDAAASLIRDDENVRRMVLRKGRHLRSRHRQPAPPGPDGLYQSLWERRDRDVLLWDFLTDQDIISNPGPSGS